MEAHGGRGHIAPTHITKELLIIMAVMAAHVIGTRIPMSLSVKSQAVGKQNSNTK
jgi:hypothetical protein